MPQKQIIIDDAVPFAEQIFGHLGAIKLMPGREIDAAAVQNADAIIVRSRTQVSQQLLAASQVKFVGSTVVGLDHVDQAWLQANNIEFYSAQGSNANSVAEYIITGIFQLAQDYQIDLANQTLGIIGVGNVGKLVQQKAEILGIKCLLNDPPRAENEGSRQFVELDFLLQHADIITLHTPLITNGKHPTLNLLNHQNLKQIKPSVILINAARGEVINEQAWTQLDNLANLIDCWQNEPEIDADLYAKADYATPHIAGHSLEAKINGAVMCYQQLCKFWEIEPQNNWQQSLPAAPASLQATDGLSLQHQLHLVFQQAYNLINDDQAIRNNQMGKINKKFESYRRNYPIRREWRQHKVTKSNSAKLNKLLKSLGFILISNG